MIEQIKKKRRTELEQLIAPREAASWEGRRIDLDSQSSISERLLQKSQEVFENDPHKQLQRNVLVNVGVYNASIDSQTARNISHLFSHRAMGEMHVSNQEDSGRCWIFAGLNLMRRYTATMFSLPKDFNNIKDQSFEFSETYLYFWDQLEKANYFLESIVEKKELPLDSREMELLLKEPVYDGGDWEMFANLVKKYGVVPLSAMPETYHSGFTHQMADTLNKRLREYAAELRDFSGSEQSLNERKEEMKQEVYGILVKFLGQPPKGFDWEFLMQEEEEGHNVLVSMKEMTPTSFLDILKPLFNIDDQIVLRNMPNAPAYFQVYEIDGWNNMVGGQAISYLNVPIEELKSCAIKSLKEGMPLWFACDVSKGFEPFEGALSTSIFNEELLFGSSRALDKKKRLLFRESNADHAMLLTGVNLDEKGNQDRWQVENSWGKFVGQQGFLSMSDSWFDEYVFEIVVDKKFLSRAAGKSLEKPPVMIKPWDLLAATSLSSCSCCRRRKKAALTQAASNERSAHTAA